MAFANGKSIWNRICKMARATEPIGQNQSTFLLIFQMTTWQRLLTNQNLHTLGEINKYKCVWFIIGLAKYHIYESLKIIQSIKTVDFPTIPIQPG